MSHIRTSEMSSPTCLNKLINGNYNFSLASTVLGINNEYGLLNVAIFHTVEGLCSI